MASSTGGSTVNKFIEQVRGGEDELKHLLALSARLRRGWTRSRRTGALPEEQRGSIKGLAGRLAALSSHAERGLRESVIKLGLITKALASTKAGSEIAVWYEPALERLEKDIDEAVRRLQGAKKEVGELMELGKKAETPAARPVAKRAAARRKVRARRAPSRAAKAAARKPAKKKAAARKKTAAKKTAAKKTAAKKTAAKKTATKKTAAKKTAAKKTAAKKTAAKKTAAKKTAAKKTAAKKTAKKKKKKGSRTG